MEENVQLNNQEAKAPNVYYHTIIPKEWINTYGKLCVLIQHYGADMLKDCNAKCSPNNKTIIDCFNMFEAAICARNLSTRYNVNENSIPESEKLGNLLYNYVTKQIDNLYKDFDYPYSVVLFDAMGNENMFIINQDKY